jgi:hypothetical protein
MTSSLTPVGYLFIAIENTDTLQSTHGPIRSAPAIDEPAAILRNVRPTTLAARLHDAVHDEDAMAGNILSRALHMALDEPDFIEVHAYTADDRRDYAIGFRPAQLDNATDDRLHAAREEAIKLHDEFMEGHPLALIGPDRLEAANRLLEDNEDNT